MTDLSDSFVLPNAPHSPVRKKFENRPVNNAAPLNPERPTVRKIRFLLHAGLQASCFKFRLHVSVEDSLRDSINFSQTLPRQQLQIRVLFACLTVQRNHGCVCDSKPHAKQIQLVPRLETV